MKLLVWFCLLPFTAMSVQISDLSKIRVLYQSAATIKQDAAQLNRMMVQVDTVTAAPVMICYKGANEMMQAKYALNPMVKLDKFNKGKQLMQRAFTRDTLNLEIRFIRYSIQSNLPAFLGYHNELEADKRYLLNNTKASKDPELQEMIFNYLSGSAVMKPDELKQLKN
jgi:hypothetical protein